MLFKLIKNGKLRFFKITAAKKIFHIERLKKRKHKKCNHIPLCSEQLQRQFVIVDINSI